MKKTKKQIYSIWHGMMYRCYNKNAKGYPSYGGKGITVAEEWHDFDTFLKWYRENEINENSAIDKDEICRKLNISPAIYSPTTCQLVSCEYNLKLRDMTQKYKKVKSINIDTKEEIEYKSLKEASEKTGISKQVISNIANRRQHVTKNLTFRYIS